MTLTVSVLSGQPIAAVTKVARGTDWIAVPSGLTGEALRRCYEVQARAVGGAYNPNAARNMLADKLLCGVGAVPSDGTSWFCSQLVAASLVAAADAARPPLPAPPHRMSPARLLAYLTADA